MGAKRLIALAVALLVFGAIATTVGARPHTAASIVLGKTANYPESGCPNVRGCEVIARVTGIQMKADAVDHPFRAPASGQLVAWWLKLPELRDTQFRSFSELFGGSPAARVSILRRGKRGRVRLVRQGPVEPLRSHLGTKGRVRFRLAAPLRIKEGDYVGLTAVTWVPAFAVGLDANNNYWLASRPKDRCSTPSSQNPERFAAYYRNSDAHVEASTVRHYRCIYRTARLIYWARIVPDPEPTSPGGGQPQPGDGAGGGNGDGRR
jgi:hypothetical protein